MSKICTSCGRKHAGNKASIGSEVCEQCFEIAGYENQVFDGHKLTKADIQDLNTLHRMIISKGGTPEHSLMEYITGAAPLVEEKKEGTKGIERQLPGTFLRPTVCADEDEVMSVAMEGTRKRPVMAINHEGEMVVCCSRTARKHGWKIEGRLFTKPAAPKKADKAETKRAQRAANLDAMLGL